MPQRSTLGMVADLVVRRVLAEHGTGPNLRKALERAYPFAEDEAAGRDAWNEVLALHDIRPEETEKPATGTQDAAK